MRAITEKRESLKGENIDNKRNLSVTGRSLEVHRSQWLMEQETSWYAAYHFFWAPEDPESRDHRCGGSREPAIAFLAGLNPTSFSVTDGKPKSNGYYRFKFKGLATTFTETRPISATLPINPKALVWVDRNPSIGKGKNQFEERVSQIKQKANLMLSTLDIERDVVVFRQCYLPSYMFPVVYLTPSLVHHVNTIEGENRKDKRQLFMESCLKIGGLQDAAVTATDRSVLACSGDGMARVRGLIAAFAEACNNNPFSLFLVSSWQEIFITTYDAIDVPSAQEWKDACEAGNHLVVWDEKEGVIIVRVESEDLAPIMLDPNIGIFGTVRYLSLKARQYSKERLQNRRSGTRDGDKQQAWTDIWGMYGDKARELVKGRATG